jgi:hypothetical protein
MAAKHKLGRKKEQTKRVVTEIAPAVRVMLDSYMQEYNEGAQRVSSPLKYTDVINQALDAFLPSNTHPDEEPDHVQGEEGKKGQAGKGRKPRAGGKAGKSEEGQKAEV